MEGPHGSVLPHTEGPPETGLPSSSAWVEKPLRRAGRLWYFSRQSALEQAGGGEETPLRLPSSPVAQRTTSHLPLGCRSVRRGKEGEKEKAREPCLPAAISIPLFFQREQPARVPRWQGSRCLGANCALFVCRRDVPSSLRDGDAVRFHGVTPRPQRGGTLARALTLPTLRLPERSWQQCTGSTTALCFQPRI